MFTSSQPQHDFAAERLFGVFGSFHSTIYRYIFYTILNIFLNEVLEHSDVGFKTGYGFHMAPGSPKLTAS